MMFCLVPQYVLRRIFKVFYFPTSYSPSPADPNIEKKKKRKLNLFFIFLDDY